MDIVLVGPGRAGLSLARRMLAAGHRIIGVAARSGAAAVGPAADLGAAVLDPDTPWPDPDLLLIAVRDDDIAAAAAAAAVVAGGAGGAVHCSGITPVAALGPLAGTMPVGSFHPLQTLPNPDAGAARLEGAWVAITASDAGFASRLHDLARSIGTRPFDLADGAKAAYHAAASAAANFPIAALGMAERLFASAGVPFEAARPLVDAVVANAFALTPAAALTGPIARGDVGTVAAQLEAVRAVDDDLAVHFAAFGRAVAALAGRSAEMGPVLR